MKFSIVLSTHAAQFDAVAFREDFEANVARIAALGYDGVELAVRDPALVDGEQVHATLAEHGLEVPAIGTGQAYGEEGLSFTDPDPTVRQRALERIKAQIEFACHFHALVILGLIRGRVQAGVEQEQAMAWLTEALGQCAAVAAPRGVRLALEPINRYETDLVNTVAQGLALIEGIGADNLGLLFDTFHANIEEPSIEGSLRAVGDRLFHVHVADSNRWYPGAGHIDFVSLVTTLRGMGYDGWLSAEILPQPDPGTAARETIAHLRGVGRLVER
ncbi:MAG: 5-keto-L-gluconate epimerase [Anaerolineae bacterium]